MKCYFALLLSSAHTVLPGRRQHFRNETKKKKAGLVANVRRIKPPRRRAAHGGLTRREEEGRGGLGKTSPMQPVWSRVTGFMPQSGAPPASA